MPRVAVYQAAFDPPTVYHRRVAEELSRRFDRVVIAPCGPRPTRGPVPDSRPIHRATMADLNFGGVPNLAVTLTDLEEARLRSMADAADDHRTGDADIWHVVSAEWVRGGASTTSVIQRDWPRGPALWAGDGFVVLKEPGEPLDDADLPPRCEVIVTPPHLPSGTVRQMLTQGEPVLGQLHPPVEAYIERHELYKDVPPGDTCRFRPHAARFQVVHDEMNPKAKALADRLADRAGDDPAMIVTAGGDGTMLRAIRKHWRDRKPFFGLNAGGLGFLLNGRELTPFWEQDLLLYQTPLLHVEAEFHDGTKQVGMAFNDTWVERATGQTAWVRVTVNGQERVPRLIGDGVLVSTAAGSNSYARAMGAMPVPLNTGVLILVGSNVLKPAFWRPVMLPLDSEIVLETADPVRRPLRGCIDSEAYPEPVRSLRVRVSRTAAAELAFLPEHDPVAKLGFVQFPRDNGN